MAQGGSWARAAVVASILAGVSYLFVVATRMSGPEATLWKGLGVGLLAVYAALNARSRDGWLIAVVMAFGALGDVLLDAAGLEAGAAAFILGHVTAIWLYLQNKRPALSSSQKWLATIVLPASVLAAVFMVPIEARPGIGIYTCFVAAMAAAAWISCFPRYRTGIGAMMFLASDLIIFGRMGPLPDNIATGFLVWSLYYLGQLLIVLGVVKTLADQGAEYSAVSGRSAS